MGEVLYSLRQVSSTVASAFLCTSGKSGGKNCEEERCLFMKATIEPIDRLAMRGRPEGMPIMQQNWEKLLFLHWPFSPEHIRPHVPEGLEIDTFNGVAWVGLTPFTVNDLAITPLPPIPGTSSFHELNMRTYVHRNGVPGVWFFTLEASKLLPTLAARAFYWLDYRLSEMVYRTKGEPFEFVAHRSDKVDADFEAAWVPGSLLPSPDTESLEFFLTERYVLYAAREREIVQARVYHAPWQLHSAELLDLETTMFDWLGVPEPIAEPLVHYSPLQKVEVWPPTPC